MRVCDFRDWPVPAPGLRAVLGLARQPTRTLLREVVGSAAPRTSKIKHGERGLTRGLLDSESLSDWPCHATGQQSGKLFQGLRSNVRTVLERLC